MSLFPVFGMRALLMLALPVALAAVILAVAGSRGTGVFKKQGVAWGITLLMVVAAIGIGYAKAPFNNPKPEAAPRPTNAPAASAAVPSDSPAGSRVWDTAHVLSGTETRKLEERSRELWGNYNAAIGVVTCNYGGNDLGGFALQCAEDMGLGGYDMIVVLDISGDNYWLLQGDKLTRDFTDDDCSNYAYNYMEDHFARGDYGRAVLDLTEALEDWYEDYYD